MKLKNLFYHYPYLCLGLCTLLLFTIGNGSLAITDSVEGNYAQTAKEMVLSGDWLSPQIYGRYWYDKPIFYYWELALSFKLFGFTEFAARLPAAIMGTLSVLLTFWFTAAAYNRRVAWLAALILATNLETWVLAKALVTDMTLFLFMSVAVACFYLGYVQDRKYYYGCYIFAALAVLTKGPIGLALPGLAVLVFLLYRRDLRALGEAHLFTGTLIFLLLTGSWYVPMYLLHGNDFLLNFFGVHNYLRATVAEHPQQNVWYFYLGMYLIGFAPWSLLAPYKLYQRCRQEGFALARLSPCTQLLLFYGVTVPLFFQCVATKYTTYTFPALFAWSILTAKLCQDSPGRIWRTAGATACVYLLLVLTVLPAMVYQHSAKGVAQFLQAADAQERLICFLGDYKATAVFYSGRKIYKAVAVPRESLHAAKLSWEAKKVMPTISLEEALRKPNSIFIENSRRKTLMPAEVVQAYEQGTYYITNVGKYYIWAPAVKNNAPGN